MLPAGLQWLGLSHNSLTGNLSPLGPETGSLGEPRGLAALPALQCSRGGTLEHLASPMQG